MVGVCPGVRQEGLLRWFAHPFSSGECRGHAYTLHLLPALQKLGFWSFFILSIICSNCTCTVIFSFCGSILLKETFVSYKPWSKLSQPVYQIQALEQRIPACLGSIVSFLGMKHNCICFFHFLANRNKIEYFSPGHQDLYYKCYRKSVGGSSCSPLKSQKTGQVGGKFALFQVGGRGRWAGRVVDIVQRLTPLSPLAMSGARAFIDRRKGPHAETAQSAASHWSLMVWPASSWLFQL